MSLVAVVDTETTGVSLETDKVIEAAWALVDVTTAEIVSLQSKLFRSLANPAEHINCIPTVLLGLGDEFAPVLLPDVDAIIAHNAPFDAQWGAFESPAPWLDTRDWRWPKASSDAKLVEIALAHGVGVVAAHRAFTDVLTLCALLRRVHESVPLAEQLAYAKLPRETYEALVSFEDSPKAKQAGFSWRPNERRWVRRMIPDDAAKLPFATRIAREDSELIEFESLAPFADKDKVKAAGFRWRGDLKKWVIRSHPDDVEKLGISVRRMDSPDAASTQHAG